MSRLLALALAASTAGAAACSSNRSADPVDPAAPAMVEVENQSFYDMTVYVVRGGMRTRLGTVSGHSQATFPIPRSFVNVGLPIRFMADPIGGGQTPYSQEIPVSPGDTVVLTIPPR